MAFRAFDSGWLKTYYHAGAHLDWDENGKFIADRYDFFLKDLETIVNIDSSSENLAGIELVALFFKKRFKAIGLETRIQKLGKNKVPCLKATNKKTQGPFDIMFLGHMDTVFPKGEVEKRPFRIDGKKE